MLTLPSFGCSSQVSPEWHGWLHYMHDKTGAQLAAELEKPFKQAHTINQTMLRPEFSREGLDPPQPPEFHQPPGTYAARVARGRVGAKYEQWSGQPSTANPELRNCERKDALQPTAFAPTLLAPPAADNFAFGSVRVADADNSSTLHIP